MEKVKQVGESYELSKLKTQNRTIELDARLSGERLLATKMRLSQISNDNERLSKQLRSSQQQLREHEKKLLLTETMLRQFVNSSSGHSASSASLPAAPTLAPPALPSLGTQRSIKRQLHSGPTDKSRVSRQSQRLIRFGGGGGRGTALASIKAAARSSITSSKLPLVSINKAETTPTTPTSATPIATRQLSGAGEPAAALARSALLGQSNKQQLSDSSEPPGRTDSGKQVSASLDSRGASGTSAGAGAKGGGDRRVGAMSLLRSTTSPNLAAASGATGAGATAVAATQTQQLSRARTIINDLRQRLNLGHSKAPPPPPSSSSSPSSLATAEANRRAPGKLQANSNRFTDRHTDGRQ